ncbi:MAG: hypothetical protein HY721_20245 [Planctomycetes bacterium]|nr:hypothetical protein [Planctomycetota bacterium]
MGPQRTRWTVLLGCAGACAIAAAAAWWLRSRPPEGEQASQAGEARRAPRVAGAAGPAGRAGEVRGAGEAAPAGPGAAAGPGWTLTGRVVRDGGPVEGVLVRLGPGPAPSERSPGEPAAEAGAAAPREARTDPAGRFAFEVGPERPSLVLEVDEPSSSPAPASTGSRSSGPARTARSGSRAPSSRCPRAPGSCAGTSR